MGTEQQSKGVERFVRTRSDVEQYGYRPQGRLRVPIDQLKTPRGGSAIEPPKTNTQQNREQR